MPARPAAMAGPHAGAVHALPPACPAASDCMPRRGRHAQPPALSQSEPARGDRRALSRLLAEPSSAPRRMRPQRPPLLQSPRDRLRQRGLRAACDPGRSALPPTITTRSPPTAWPARGVRPWPQRPSARSPLPAFYTAHGRIREMDLNTDLWARAHGKSSRRVAGLDPSDCRVGARTSVLVCHHGDEKAPLGLGPLSGSAARPAPRAHAPAVHRRQARHAGPHFQRSAGVG